MAGSNSWHISFFFFLIIPCAAPLYFNLSPIGPHDANVNINITGAAYITEEGIQVTPNERNVTLGRRIGRATYIKPLHLYDKASGITADFTTHLSFVIDSEGSDLYGDGLAFFLAPVGSNIPENAIGGSLGLVGLNQTSNTNSTVGQFVAVEFDTYHNPWDPPFTHVGININSMVSASTERVIFGFSGATGNLKLSAYFDEQEMERLMIVGLWCAHPDPSHRPSIRQVIHVLNIDAPLPVLPSKMPVPTYSAHTLTLSQLLSYSIIIPRASSTILSATFTTPIPQGLPHPP